MLRNILTGASLACLGAAALAQQTAPLVPAPEAKDAGVYHLATGTWTRGGPATLRGTHDVLYDNTCETNWYFNFNQRTFHDDGRIPSTSSPQVDQGMLGSGTYATTSLVGTQDLYAVNAYQIGYCTGVVGPVSALELFYECYVSCSDASLLTPTASIVATGLPGAPTAGTVACWTVTIDLTGTTDAFTLHGDCDGVWDGTAAQDYLGYGFLMVTPDPTGQSGPMLAGDPDGLSLAGPGGTGCCVGCNTAFFAGANVPGTSTRGSGLNDQDFFEIDDHLGGFAFTYNGCYWYGGYSTMWPHASSYLRILGDAAIVEPGTAYCFGHTSQGNPCPCSNDNDQTDPRGAGCANGISAAGARLRASGVASVNNDTLVLFGMRGQPNNWSLFFQATNSLDGTGSFLGDGILCAGGSLKHLAVRRNGPGGSSDTSGVVISARSAAVGYTIQPGDTLRYQWWFRDTVSPACGSGLNDSNTSNGYEITWLP